MTTSDESLVFPVDVPEELLELQGYVRKIVTNEVIPYEKEGELPPDVQARVHDKLREIGTWGLGVPAEHGGSGLSALGFVMVCEEYCRTTLWEPLYNAGNAFPGFINGSQDLLERYYLPTVRGELSPPSFALTEPQGGSDPGGMMQTTAVREGDDWILDGRKTFISYGDKSDYVLVFAITDKKLRQRGGISLFVVDRDNPGMSVVRKIPTMGSHTPVELDFTDCRVSDANRLGDVGQGFALAQSALGKYRLMFGGYAVGAAGRLLEMALDYASAREAFGKTLSEQGQIQAMLADIAIDIETCRWMTYRAAVLHDRGEDTRIIDSMVKVYASEMIGRVSDKVMQIHGGWGYSQDFPIERFLRDSRFARIVEGPNEMHRWLISRELVKRRAAGKSVTRH
ncbi:acyl-CoA dehydrogenase family protein [Microbacterium sp. A93]|uniref:acyl-CoA dehydrogenase family protein n=1 Tax=Microbacterium sp. A93 TaxID=3450716 RepID=UPI003F41CBFD